MCSEGTFYGRTGEKEAEAADPIELVEGSGVKSLITPGIAARDRRCDGMRAFVPLFLERPAPASGQQAVLTVQETTGVRTRPKAFRFWARSFIFSDGARTGWPLRPGAGSVLGENEPGSPQAAWLIREFEMKKIRLCILLALSLQVILYEIVWKSHDNIVKNLRKFLKCFSNSKENAAF